MKKRILVLALSFLLPAALYAQEIVMEEGLLHKGDNPAWKEAAIDESDWITVSTSRHWTLQGVGGEYDYGWYRLKAVFPESMRRSAPYRDAIVITMLGGVDDSEETFLNGTLVGKTGSMPEDQTGFLSAWNWPRRYLVPADLVRWGEENLIAIRVFNGTDAGGIHGDAVRISMAGLEDLLGMTIRERDKAVDISFSPMTSAKGTVRMEVTDAATSSVSSVMTGKIKLKKGRPTCVSFPLDLHRQTILRITFTDTGKGISATKRYVPKYILTPEAPASPRYNGPLAYGARPGSPVIFRLPFSGARPMHFTAEGLPDGITLDAENGILHGTTTREGRHEITFQATNSEGSVSQPFTLVIGPDAMALTPPMGWNSWNCWGTSVSQDKVISSARAILSSGLADYGYAYINIDDAWQAPQRADDGTIVPNDKFPDMKGLGDWLHSNGLKFGIYSSPGSLTCGLYTGSLGHELADAQTYNAWGIDYLKYDWCVYQDEFNRLGDYSLEGYILPYRVMQEHLRAQPRDIFYSLCQYGMADVWKWGASVGGNSWRTTPDITDSWASLYEIGFVRQKDLHPYAGHGHWNDPDMLIVGKVGWSSSLRDSRLTPDEQYTHISLWNLLAANMLIGCDVAQIDGFTLGLLCNHEVNAVGQDLLGRQARCVLDDGTFQVWARPLADGSTAAGIFNLSGEDRPADIRAILEQAGIRAEGPIRDLWRQEDLQDTACIIPTHGVRLLRFQ